MDNARPGETILPEDPGDNCDDARLVFIGRLQTPWTERSECPKNMRQARERGQPARIVVDKPYRQGLLRLDRCSHVIVLTWFDRSRRDLIVQFPAHASRPSGTFALRSPVRPNPIGLHVARITGIDHDAGLVSLEAIDALDGTPVIDIKPYLPGVDKIDDATVADD